MPPKAKFEKEEIINAALGIVRENGFSALTARALGAKLKSSACPIFTVFKNMEEVKKQVISAARSLYREYVKRGLLQTPAFKGVGMQYILFASNEPKLFSLLFMNEPENIPDFEGILPMIDENYYVILLSLKESYGLSDTSAKQLYNHLWIYTHGIATLCATNMCRFTAEQISIMVTQVFSSLLEKIKSEE